MENIPQAIDLLCEKFGTTFPKMVEELTRVAYVRNISGVVIGAIFLCVCAFLIHIKFKWHIENEEISDIWIWVGIIMTFIFGSILFFVCLVDLIGWITSPDGSTIDYLLNKLR